LGLVGFYAAARPMFWSAEILALAMETRSCVGYWCLVACWASVDGIRHQWLYSVHGALDSELNHSRVEEVQLLPIHFGLCFLAASLGT
jgi:hypothetical protein